MTALVHADNNIILLCPLSSYSCQRQICHWQIQINPARHYLILYRKSGAGPSLKRQRQLMHLDADPAVRTTSRYSTASVWVDDEATTKHCQASWVYAPGCKRRVQLSSSRCSHDGRRAIRLFRFRSHVTTGVAADVTAALSRLKFTVGIGVGGSILGTSFSASRLS